MASNNENGIRHLRALVPWLMMMMMMMMNCSLLEGLLAEFIAISSLALTEAI